MSASDALLTSCEPYRERPVRFLGIWRHAGWRLKAYGISRDGLPIAPELVAAARRAVRRRLPSGRQAGPAPAHYRVGFVGVHQGRGGNLVFVDWWTDENELRHHVYTSSQEEPGVLHCHGTTGLLGCVWDLGVIWFERMAWVATVLHAPGNAALEAYLSVAVDGSV